MSRLIDADALMETLGITDINCEKCDWGDGRSRCIRGSDFEDACVAIENAPTIESEQQWIPVTERLPEKADGKYWVCTDTEYQCQCRWTDDVYGLGSNGEWAWKIFDIPQYSHVVAWMPLPEPYREGEQDEDR